MSKQSDEANIELYKKVYYQNEKLLKRIVKHLPTDLLIEELKKRKLVKFDWNDKKWKRVSKGNEVKE